jgi:hypothetical protein
LVVILSLLLGMSPLVAQERPQSLADIIVLRSYTDDLPGIQKRKVVRVLVNYNRTDYFAMH